MKRIIPYCTSGLGNRLRCVASCYVISQETDRELKIYWDNLIPNGCLAKLDELFENDLQTISLEELKELKDYKMCINKYDADREDWEFKNDTLRNLTDVYGADGKHSYTHNDQQENVLVFNISFLDGINLEKSHDFIRSLKPIKGIQDNIDKIKNDLGLSKDVIGIHARGTDFLDSSVEAYMENMLPYLEKNPNQKFFISTEDPEMEKTIVNSFPNNVLFRKKENYITKEDEKDSWLNHNNFYITKDHAQEAVEDMFLLAETTIGIYDNRSTFAELAIILSQRFLHKN